MPSLTVDYILGDALMHSHSSGDIVDLTTTLDPRYVNITGDTMGGNLIFPDNNSVLLGTGSDGELFHDGSNTYFQNNTGNIIIENDATDGDITFKVNDAGVDTTVMTLDGATGNVGIGTTVPSYKLSVQNTGGATLGLYTSAYGGVMTVTGGASDNSFYMYPASGITYYSTIGVDNIFALTNSIGSTTVTVTSNGSSFFNGGNVGIGTTSPDYKLQVNGVIAPETDGQDLGVTSTLRWDAYLNVLAHEGTTLGFFGTAPTTQQTELTDELTTITFTAPGTPDYAIQDLVDSSAGATFGFATKDEGNSVLAVVANLQVRVNELETKLVAYGLLIDVD